MPDANNGKPGPPARPDAASKETCMSSKLPNKTAEYFEDRTRRTRNQEKRKRLVAVAQRYRARVEVNASLAAGSEPVRHCDGREPRDGGRS